MNRRSFLASAVAMPALACTRRANVFEEPLNVEITAVMSVPREALSMNEYESILYGTGDDGHTHNVVVESAALKALSVQGSVIVRSGPASTDRHRHWVRVTVA